MKLFIATPNINCARLKITFQCGESVAALNSSTFEPTDRFLSIPHYKNINGHLWRGQFVAVSWINPKNGLSCYFFQELISFRNQQFANIAKLP
jgi:hypothetical protein